MKKLVMMLVTMMLTVNLFAGTAIVKIKKADGNVQRTVLDTNSKIANMMIFMKSLGGKIKMKMHTSGVGTFAEASKQKPYFFIWYDNDPNFGMYMWKSDFEEVLDEMKGEKK